MVRPAWCRLDRDLWKVWNIPKMKKESEGQWRWWVSHFFLNLVTKWRWQGVKSRVPIAMICFFGAILVTVQNKLINIQFCRKRYEMMRIIVLFMFVYAYIYIYSKDTHTQTHIRVRPQLGRRSPTPSREVINPAFICISTRKRPTFCWWNVNCMAALVINLLRALPAKLALSGDTWSLKKKNRWSQPTLKVRENGVPFAASFTQSPGTLCDLDLAIQLYWELTEPTRLLGMSLNLTHTEIHTYLYTYIYIHRHTQTHTHTDIHTYTHTYLPTYLHTYTPTYLLTYLPTYVCTHAHTHARTDRQTDIQTDIT